MGDLSVSGRRLSVMELSPFGFSPSVFLVVLVTLDTAYICVAAAAAGSLTVALLMALPSR